MALNHLEDRLECAIRHINTALDIDPWAQNLAVESMRMRIALMKGGQPEIIRCRDCIHLKRSETNSKLMMCQRRGRLLNLVSEFDYCSKAERKADD